MTTVEYSVPTASYVRFTVYNIQGQVVATMVNGIESPGYYFSIRDGTGAYVSRVASGVYFHSLDMDHYAQARKMAFLKSAADGLLLTPV